jgi:ubiquinone/menaquinone biosynthesis C-methylase UbiE
VLAQRELSGVRDWVTIQRWLRTLLGKGEGGTCLEIGCGTGVHAATIRELGWRPAGIDISAGMLRYARGRLAIVRADSERLPFRDGSLPAVISVMTYTPASAAGSPTVATRGRS